MLPHVSSRRVLDYGRLALALSGRWTVAKVVCVLYPDPVDGYPKGYARDGVPAIARYPSGQTTPTPSRSPDPYAHTAARRAQSKKRGDKKRGERT